MDWSTLLATVLGAAVAMSTSLMVERRKDRHDAESAWRRAKYDQYAAFLMALTSARWALLDIARDKELEPEERHRRADRAFAACYMERHRLELCAPDDVALAAAEYFRMVREFRDRVRDGSLLLSQEAYTELKGRAKKTMLEARRRMTADILPDTSGSRYLARDADYLQAAVELADF